MPGTPASDKIFWVEWRISVTNGCRKISLTLPLEWLTPCLPMKPSTTATIHPAYVAA